MRAVWTLLERGDRTFGTVLAALRCSRCGGKPGPVYFREAEGRSARDRAELSAWVARSDVELPVVPRASLLEPYLD